MKLALLAALVAAFSLQGTAAAHRLSGHPKTTKGQLALARAQVRHDRAPGDQHWRKRDGAYVRKMKRAAYFTRVRMTQCYGAAPSACAWYLRGDTQCEVRHEGAFWSVSPGGKYAGRFQMDSDFERSNAYGAAAQRRWGRANLWPPGVQINHAYMVWLKRGWHPWPPYYRFGCARYA